MKTLPIGAIIMWKNSSSTIPTGWAICDGNNGTPNLVGCFVQGASSDGEVGTGTSSGNHSHTQPSASSSDGSHTHPMSISISGSSGTTSNVYKSPYTSSPKVATSGHGHSGGSGTTGTSNPANHSHTAGGTTGTTELLPTHCLLYYIMRVQ